MEGEEARRVFLGDLTRAAHPSREAGHSTVPFSRDSERLIKFAQVTQLLLWVETCLLENIH